MPRSRESGSVLVFILVFLALVVLSLTAVYAVSEGKTQGTVLSVLGVSLAVALAGLYAEGKRDLDAALTFVSVFCVLVAVCTVIYLFSADRHGTASVVTAAVSGTAGLGLGFVTFRRQRGPDSALFPNVLRSTFGPASLLEKDGIQYTGRLEPGSGASPHRASLFLQNCHEGARRVQVTFEAASAAKYLRFHKTVAVDLGPAEVVQLTVPVIAPTYPGSYPLFFDIAASGERGKRVRLWRAKVPDSRVKPGATAAFLAVGVLAFGGGVHFTVGPLPADLWNSPLAAPEVKSLWRAEGLPIG